MPMCNISGQLSVVAASSSFMDRSTSISGFDCSWLHRVRAGVPVTLLKFFPGADRFRIHDAIDCENTVEMIDLVLQQLGQVSVLAGPQRERLAIDILIAH